MDEKQMDKLIEGVFCIADELVNLREMLRQVAIDHRPETKGD